MLDLEEMGGVGTVYNFEMTVYRPTTVIDVTPSDVHLDKTSPRSSSQVNFEYFGWLKINR